MRMQGFNFFDLESLLSQLSLGAESNGWYEGINDCDSFRIGVDSGWRIVIADLETSLGLAVVENFEAKHRIFSPLLHYLLLMQADLLLLIKLWATWARLRSCSYSGFKGCIKYQGNGRNLSHSLPALIILFMLKLLSVLALAVSATCLVEPTDFDYRNHGADWAACPSSGTLCLLQLRNNPPSSFLKTPPSCLLRTPTFSANSRKRPQQSTIWTPQFT